MALYDKWLDGAIARLGYIKAERWQPVEAAFAGESPLWPGTAGNLTDEQRERLAVASAWVYSDVREIANLGSAARINVMRSQGEQETAEVNHPFEILMRRPTPRMRVGYGSAVGVILFIICVLVMVFYKRLFMRESEAR